MRKIDYEILAAAIKKHGTENIDTPLHYANADQVEGAQIGRLCGRCCLNLENSK